MSNTYPAPKLVTTRPLASSPDEPISAEQRKRMNGPIIAGGIVVLVFVVGFIVWAAVFSIAGGVPAPGVIVVENSRKSVEHLDGGVVKEIRVHEGDHVTKGQVLFVMDDTQPQAQVDVLESEYDSYLAQKARLDSELAELPDVVFPPELLAKRKDPRVDAILRGQETLFRANKGVYTSQVGVLNQRMQEQQSRTQGLQAQVTAVDEQSRLVQDELSGVDKLYQQGFAPKSRLLQLQRSQADLVGERGAREADIASTGQAAGETQMQLAQIRQQRATVSADTLRQVPSQIDDVLPRLRAAQAVLNRTVVRAPVEGDVLGLTQFTQGGVVKPGERLLDIVPKDDTLVAKVNIKPDAVHEVRVGMKAQLKLLGFSRNTPNLNAKVVEVSADHIVNERGEAYFTADLTVSPQELKRVPDLKLMPGMPVTVTIVTGDRSIMEYLIGPFTSTFADAMHER